jgi:hypothetical protein
LEKFKSVFRGHLTSINKPPRKEKNINYRKEIMPIDRHIHYSKVVVNPHPVLMAHDLCMFMNKGWT